MISINAAVEVDLFGQVCASRSAESMSGSGGQIDYVRGACQSRGGKSFIAFTSTAKGGTISKIKPILTPGAVVTTSKNDVDYIVTEYGVAHLRGRSLGERARQLIAIAHPDFRDELTFEAKARHYDLISYQYNESRCPVSTVGWLFRLGAFCISKHIMVTRVSSRNAMCAKRLHSSCAGDCSLFAARL